MKPFADLHIHTNMSDGSDSVDEVLSLARDNSVSFLSITDHNTLNAYSETAFVEASQVGIHLIPGVELDVIYKKKQYHLLAYGVDLQNSALREVCAHNTNVQEESNLSLLRLMEKDSLGVSEEAYHKYAIPQGRGGWKLLNYLLDIGMTKNLLEGTKYYGQYGVSSNYINFVGLEEAVRIVKAASGIPILAHPAEQIPYNQYEKGHDGFWSTLDDLCQTQIEGIECVHPLHGFDLQDELISFCKAKELYISGGTDYHGRFFNKQKQTIGGQLIRVSIVNKLISKIK